VGDKLLLFLWRMRATPGEGLGFRYERSEALLVDNPEDDPPAWRMAPVDVPAAPDGFALGTGAAFVEGDTLWLLAAREPGDHRMALARVVAAEAARGSLASLSFVGGRPRPLFEGATELSLSAIRDGYVVVQSRGFGAAPIAVRTASRLDDFGPPIDVYRPPENDVTGAFVYSAKAHPELGGPDDLVVTYCSNHSDFSCLVSDASLYFPRFVRIRVLR
jgi:hypothetical protein